MSADEGFRVRFKREARIQAGIDHAHIVSVYEAGELEEEGLYIAMQIVRGPNLKELVSAGELNPARVLRLLTPVADALDTAHEANLVHRDIKPHNILVGRRDHAYLADFGLTRRPGDTNVTRTGAFVGTLDYAAPEQIEGEVPTARTDVYSFGALAFECLTGAVPFPRVPKPPSCSPISAGAAARLRSVADLPSAVDAALQRALAKAPADRQASAVELMAELDSALHDVSPYQVPPPQASTERPFNGDTLPLDDAGGPPGPTEPTVPVARGPVTPAAPTRPAEPAVAQAPPPMAPPLVNEPTEMRSRVGALTREDPRPGREAAVPRPAPAAPAPARARAPRIKVRRGAVAALAAVPVAAVLGLVIGGSGSSSPQASLAPEGSKAMKAGGLSVAVRRPGTASPCASPAASSCATPRARRLRTPRRAKGSWSAARLAAARRCFPPPSRTSCPRRSTARRSSWARSRPTGTPTCGPAEPRRPPSTPRRRPTAWPRLRVWARR